MPKRRRLLTPVKNRSKANAFKQEASKFSEKEESTPRGRLKGALLEALEPSVEESDASTDHSPVKKERKDYTSEEDDRSNRVSPPRQSYVLKLFDRSVDLSQFSEDSPLYPICRAWITNQPKANYKDLGNQGSRKLELTENTEDSVELPGPEGPPVSRIPDLIPEQLNRSKDNINLNYAPAPSREQLLRAHAARWAAVLRRHAAGAQQDQRQEMTAAWWLRRAELVLGAEVREGVRAGGERSLTAALPPQAAPALFAATAALLQSYLLYSA